MNTMHSKISYFSKRVIWLTSFSCIVLFSTLANAQASKLNKTEFVFGNGSGWESIGTESTPSMRAKKPVMLRNGQTIESILDSQSASFYRQFTTPTQMLSEVKLRMTGMIGSFGYVPQPSTGWLVCDGSEYSTASYQNLANLLRNTYGGTGLVNADGDWAGTFKVPDLRGVFIMGSVSTRNLTSVTLNNTIPYHQHTFSNRTLTTSQPIGNHSHGIFGLLEYRANMDDDEVDANSTPALYRSVRDTSFPNSSFTTTLHSHSTPALTVTFGPSTYSSTPTQLVTENRPSNAAVIYCIFTGR
jgi:microcystin-dependent protein